MLCPATSTSAFGWTYGSRSKAHARRHWLRARWPRPATTCLCLWDKLTRFLECPELEFSNNLVENSMRPIALGRGIGSMSGACRYSRTGTFNLRQLSTSERITPIFGPACFSWESRQTDWNILPRGGFPDKSLASCMFVSVTYLDSIPPASGHL